jgi:hypothetical protein
MNSELLLEYLDNPMRLYKVPYQELKTLVVEYPYCQNLRYLLLCKSEIEQLDDKQRNLSLAAAYTPDRKHLYQLMQQLWSKAEKDPNALDIDKMFERKEAFADDEVLDLSLVPIGLYRSDEEMPLASKQLFDVEIDIDLGSNEQDDALPPEVHPIGNQNHTKNIPDVAKQAMHTAAPPIDHLPLLNSFDINGFYERQRWRILAVEVTGGVSELPSLPLPPLVDSFRLNDDLAAMLTAMEQEAAIDKEIEQALAKLVERQARERSKQIPLEITNESALTKEAKAVDIGENPVTECTEADLHGAETDDKETIVPQSPALKISFSSWLKKQKAPSLRASRPAYTKLAKPLDMANPHKKRKKSKKGKKLKKLLKAKHDVQEKKSSRDRRIIAHAYESLRMNNEIASETLARILAEQQQIGEAIKMYERLALQYPEKSRYFAAEIEKLIK